MKNLPYYKLWVKDFDTNESVRLLDLREAGLFLFCLNHAWINDGLPNSPDDIARALKIAPATFSKMWDRVGKCFFVGNDGRLRNGRQEEERAHAISKSRQASDAVAKREQKRNVRSSDDTSDDASDDHLRARMRADSDCGSASDVFSSKKKVVAISSSRFPEFWSKYPRKFGEDSACRDWCSEVTSENETVAFACLDRYLASDEVQRGVVMSAGSTMKDTGWIVKCARDGWKCEWPKAREPTRAKGFVADVTEVMQRNMLEKGTPW